MSEITKRNDIGGNNKFRFVWPAIFALVVFVYFFGLSIPLLGPDEPRYAQVAREMFDQGDWVTPTLGGFNWFEKPAMLYWLEIVAYRLIGVNEIAARLGPAIFGLGTILSLWLLGNFVENFQRSTTKGQRSSSEFQLPAVYDLANWTALIAASSLGILVFSRGASFDIIVTFPITAALVSFFFFDQRRTRTFGSKYVPLILFYFFIGIALLAKGLIGIVFPFAIVGFYYLLSLKRPDNTFIASILWGTLISVAVASVWYLPMYGRHGYAFFNEFFVQHHFQRFTSNKYQHPQPFYFFFWILPLMTIPWLPFFIASGVSNAREIFRQFTASPRHLITASPLVLFSVAWLAVPLVFFSASGSKLPGYILPSVPAAILLTAIYFCRLAGNSRKWRISGLLIGPATLLIVSVLLVTAVPHFADGDSVKGLFAKTAERGFTSERVLNFRSTSHNAEFYAAGRLLRDQTGKQLQIWTAPEVRNEIAALGGSPLLVLTPVQNVAMLTSEPSLTVDVIGDNGELAIMRVSLRPIG
jgi:4-amino-4-deoxy-L-arabinose transferase-like glycosyltransferase